MADNPITRKEKYLAKLTGSYTGNVPAPITRVEKYLYDLCQKGISGLTPEEIENAVNKYLKENPVQPGATEEQAQQIEQNKTDIASLKTETGSLKEDLKSMIPKNYNEIFTAKKPNNMIVKHNTKNGFIANSTGEIVPSAEYFLSNPIDVVAGEDLYFSHITSVVYYNGNKFLAFVIDITETTQKVPANATKMIANIYSGYIDICAIYRGKVALDYDEGFIDYDKTYLKSDTEIKSRYNSVYTKIKPNNMIVRCHMVNGYYVDTTGEKKTSNGWSITDKVHLNGIESLFFNLVGLTCFYDSNGLFISYAEATNYGVVKIPQNASYLIASIPNENLDRCAIYNNDTWLQYDEGVIEYEKITGKKEYADGYIRFTVPVNQEITDLTDTTNTLVDKSTIVNVDCILSLPTTYKHYGSPTKLIMMCHGAGRGVSGSENWTTIDSYNSLVNRFKACGYAVFDCNGYKNDEQGYNAWGCQRGLETWRKAYQYVINNYNVEIDFSIYAFSMGGLTAINLAFQNFPNIKCIALGSPVLDLSAVWDNDNIRAAYGGAKTYSDDVAGSNNPFHNLIDINNKKYCLKKIPPLKIWYGSTETTWGTNKQYAIDFVQAIKNGGGYAEYREVAGGTHGLSYGENPNMVTEFCLWFDRYSTRY